MSWLIRHQGMEFSSDDFLIEDLGAVEKATGESWAIANPLRNVAVAKAFLAAAMLRTGRPEAEVESALTLVKLRQLKKAFTYVDDDGEEEDEEVDPSAPTPSPTSVNSSTGAPPKGGRPPSPESNVSAIA